MSIDSILLPISLVAGALVAGGLALVSLGIVRAARTLDAQTWPSLHRALNSTIGPYVSKVLAVAILAAAATAVASVGGRILFAAAAAMFGCVLAVSLSVNVPINRAIARWTVAPPLWERVRERWNTFQHLRAVLALAGFALVLAGASGV
jgi:hypothetical protein